MDTSDVLDSSNIVNDFEELLAAVQGENDAFIKLIARHNSKEDSFDIDEVISFLQNKQLTELWNILHAKCSAVLVDFSRIDRQDPDNNIGVYAAVCHGIVVIATASVFNQEAVPEMLFETAALLHGILLLLPEECGKLRDSIVSLCEIWWSKNISGREELVSQTIPVLIQKILAPKALKADVKRIWKMHEALNVVEWSDPGSDALKLLLMQVPRSHSVMGSEQGRKLVAFMFGLSESLLSELHSTMKSLIPFANSSMLDWIGDVYFNAFKMLFSNEAALLEKFETTCIQDLMYSGIHAPRVARHGASKPLSSCVHQILSVLHQQKHQKGVDQMLTRLYKPFIWRSLKVANADVRANAAFLFFDAFPFVDSSEDDLSHRQIEAMKALLNDKSHVVRCIAVKAVCNICTNFWSLLSSDDIKTFITTLVQKLAWDASFADIRLAVVKGMEQMVGNNLTHSVLQPVLPTLRNLFHDDTDKVRVGMVDLLIRIKGIKSFKFWSVVPMDHILARLELEKSVLRNRLVQLLFESFLPLDQPLDTQLDRCIYLWQKNAGASRNFYLTCYRHMDLRATCNFILYILKFVMSLVLKEYGNPDETSMMETEGSSHGSINSEAGRPTESENAEPANEPEPAIESEPADESENANDHNISVKDEPLMAGLFETVALLWMGINTELSKVDLEIGRKRLQAKVSVYLPIFFRSFNSAQVHSPLYMICSFIPPSDLMTVSCSLISKLRSFTTDSSENDYGCMLEMMCQWKKGSDVLELIYDWLQPCLMPKPTGNRRDGPMVRFAEPVVSNPRMALRYLEFLMHQTVCRISLLENNRMSLRRIADCLKKSQDFLEKCLMTNNPLEDPLTEELLLMAFQRRLRMEVLLHTAEKTTDDLMKEIDNVLSWFEIHVLPTFKKERLGSHPNRRARKLVNPVNCTLIGDPMESEMLSQSVCPSRVAFEGSLDVTQNSSSQSSAVAFGSKTEFTKCLVENLIEFGVNLFTVGVCDHELASHFGELSLLLLRLDVGVTFLPGVTRLVDAMIHAVSLTDAGDEGIGHCDGVIQNVLKEILSICSVRMVTMGINQQQAEKILSEFSSSLEDALLTYFEQLHNLENDSSDVSRLTDSVLTAVIHDLQNVIAKDSTFEPQTSFKGLPPLSAALLHAMFGRLHTARLYLSQFEIFLKSSTERTLESLSSCVHLLYVVICCTDFKKFKELDACAEALAAQLEAFTLPEDALDNSTLGMLLVASRDLIGRCATKLHP